MYPIHRAGAAPPSIRRAWEAIDFASHGTDIRIPDLQGRSRSGSNGKQRFERRGMRLTRPVRKPNRLFLGVLCFCAGSVIAGAPALSLAQPGSRMPMMPGMPPITGAPAPVTTVSRPLYGHPVAQLLAVLVVVAAGYTAYRVLPRRRRSVRAAQEAVLVVDLVESTHFATHYGDTLAMRARNALKDRALDVARPHGLAVAESTGDGWFMTFPAVSAAVNTAVELLRSLGRNPPDLAPAPAIEARAAITYGEILVDARGGRPGATINKAFPHDRRHARELRPRGGCRAGPGRRARPESHPTRRGGVAGATRGGRAEALRRLLPSEGGFRAPRSLRGAMGRTLVTHFSDCRSSTPLGSLVSPARARVPSARKGGGRDGPGPDGWLDRRGCPGWSAAQGQAGELQEITEDKANELAADDASARLSRGRHESIGHADALLP
jgi:hypothetical protein